MYQIYLYSNQEEYAEGLNGISLKTKNEADAKQLVDVAIRCGGVAVISLSNDDDKW